MQHRHREQGSPTSRRQQPSCARYDLLVRRRSAPATGHGLDMLRVPKVIVELSPPGLLRTDAERAWRMFQDPARAGVVVVTLPEELPTTETLELILNVYADEAVTRVLATSFTSVWRRSLAFHLSQAALSLQYFRKIARLLRERLGESRFRSD